jgi:hypothetical protein
VPAVIEFVDIAGLVKGAATGEGLGNKFLSHIREVDAIVQVVRCFEDVDIHHVSGTVDPVRDIEVINTELILADLESVQKRTDRQSKQAKRGDKEAMAEMPVLAKIETVLDSGKPAILTELTTEERVIAKNFFLLTDKPTIFACNVKDTDLATADSNPFVQKVREYAKNHLACEATVISAQIESDLVDLEPGGCRSVPGGPRRQGIRCRLADPRDLPPARSAHLLHGRREGSARLDDPRWRHGAHGGRRHPQRLREVLHPREGRRLRRLRGVQRHPGRARQGRVLREGQGLRRAGW